jgi:chromosome segregation ATPase
MKRASMWGIAGAALFGVLTFRATVAGQTAAPNQETLAALLVEVRGLRAAMEQMAAAGPRVQLTFGRLQMQEQRVNTLIRRADELRAKVAETQGALGNARGKLEQLQRALERNANLDERNALETMIPELKRQIALTTNELQRLQTEEADASSQVLAEQARWTDINQRLEELERALAR